MKASRSPGLREVMTPSLTTTLEFPFRAGVDDVRFDGLVRGHSAALGDSCLDQKVADGGDNFLLVEDLLDEGERLGLDAPQVRIDLTAGENDRVIIRSRNLTQCLDLDRSTSVLLVPSLDFAGPKRNDVDFGAGGLKFVAGNLQFGLFKALGGENGYSFVREVAWVIAPGKFPPEPIRRRPDRSLRVEPNAETSKSWARLTGPPAWILPCWIGVTFRWSRLSCVGRFHSMVCRVGLCCRAGLTGNARCGLRLVLR